MTTHQIIEWMLVLLVASALVSLIIFMWVLIRDIWRGQ